MLLNEDRGAMRYSLRDRQDDESELIQKLLDQRLFAFAARALHQFHVIDGGDITLRRVVYLSISETAKKSLDVLSLYLHDRVAKAMASIPMQDREIMARSLRTLLKSLYEED